MADVIDAGGLLDRAYEDVVLILGGFVAVQGVPSDATWKLMGEITAAWFAARGKASRMEDARDSTETAMHPAMRSSLAAVRAGG